jgi:phage-related protein
VQRGLTPRGFKPLHGIGSGVAEIKISAPGGDAYRVVYVAKFDEAVYVPWALSRRNLLREAACRRTFRTDWSAGTTT